MLSLSQQSALTYHLRETNLLINEELILELTDHYAIALEERMKQGMTFETSITSIQTDFGGRKGLQKMERQHNRVTFRHYDILFMNYVRQQGRWPKLLIPLLTYIVAFWVTTHRARPNSFSLDMLIYSPWGGFMLGCTIGLFLQFFRLMFRHGIHRKNLSPDALYLLTRFLPINLIQFGFWIALIYWAQVFPPYVYEATLSASISISVTYMLSYSQFQSVIQAKPNFN